MAIDSMLPLRRAVLSTLSSDKRVSDLVKAGSIYGTRVGATPSWPFIRYQPVTGTPIRGACLDGQEVTFRVHAFAKPRVVGRAIVETAEDYAYRIGAAVAATLDYRRLTLPQGHATLRWQSAQLVADPDEADSFQTIQTFRGRCMTSHATLISEEANP